MSNFEDGMGFSGLAPGPQGQRDSAYWETRDKIAAAREKQLKTVIADRDALRAINAEMLEALRMVRDANHDEPHIPPIALAKIEAALAAAEGKQ